MLFRWFALVAIMVAVTENEGANILGLFTVPSKSHSILAYELFKELVKAGHQVTVINPEGCELQNPPANYTNIVIGGDLKDIVKEIVDKSFYEVDDSPFLKFQDMINQTIFMSKYFVTHPKVQALLKSDTKFDLVISELALNEATLGFSEYYKCPHILISTVGATSWVSTVTNNPNPYSYVPHAFLDLTDKMTLFERLQNTLFNLVEDIVLNYFYYGKQQEIYENAFPGSESFRPFWDKMKHGVSLIEVGGMHIKKKANPLPADIQKFIDESEHGVVYFSLGGNLNPSVMPVEKQQAIIKALSKLKQRIIWKWDDLDAKVDRNKFLVKNWFPQDDILANPKVKVFVTHGGLLGGTEAIYYAKPLVTIPIFGDQKFNAARSSKTGYGVRVDYSNLTEASLTWGLNEVINNRKYSDRVKELSERFRDKPQHPVDLAKYYVEYVIRHKGAPHMQSSSTHLSFIQLNNLDVYAIIGAILFLVVFIPYFLLKKLLQKIFCGSSNSSPSKKQKKTKKN